MQGAQEVALTVRRVGANGHAVGSARDKTPREEFLDDDRVAIQEIVSLIAEREWARSASGTNHTKALSEQRSRTERERVVRLLNVGGHTNSGNEMAQSNCATHAGRTRALAALSADCQFTTAQ